MIPTLAHISLDIDHRRTTERGHYRRVAWLNDGCLNDRLPSQSGGYGRTRRALALASRRRGLGRRFRGLLLGCGRLLLDAHGWRGHVNGLCHGFDRDLQEAPRGMEHGFN